ncbi:hypothetical protein ScPMuIL_017133 [Solemya velum]
MQRSTKTRPSAYPVCLVSVQLGGTDIADEIVNDGKNREGEEQPPTLTGDSFSQSGATFVDRNRCPH